MGRQMYFYYLEWLLYITKTRVVNITVLLFLNNQNEKLVILVIC